MWILTCHGDLFGNKPIWLRPGSTHLLGRTTAKAEHGERVRYIEHKGVSRKHLLIEVSPVVAGDSAHIHARSKLTLTDNSKTGTTINNQEKLHKTSHSFEKAEFDIKLGSYEHVFHLKWQPIVLTFTNLPKSAKSRGDALAEYRRTLEQTDVKLVTEFLNNITTHVVASKRNNPSCLQALAQAKWPVSYGFVDALASVSTRTGVDANGDFKVSLLEEDLQSNWPSEDQYLIPAGVEPVHRPEEYLKPNPARSEVFAGFVFIFMLQSQYENLLAVITSCGGKALLRGVHPAETTADDFVNFVKEAAGSKTNAQARLASQSGKGGTVVVRPSEQKDNEIWWRTFDVDVQLALGIRSILQNEFLDAILTTDTSGLSRPLEQESTGAGESVASTDMVQNEFHRHAARTSRAVTPSTTTNVEVTEQPGPSSARNKPRRIIAQSRFKGFDAFDDFDPHEVVRPTSASPGSPSNHVDVPSKTNDKESERRNGPAEQTRTNRKRHVPFDDPEENGEDMDRPLPGVAAMKKRRLEEGLSNMDPRQITAPEDGESNAVSATNSKSRGKERQAHVKGELQIKREHAEEERRKDQEALQAQLQGMDLGELRSWVKVEDFDLPPRQAQPQSADDRNDPSDRWDPAWNGRANFKRFRRHGQGRNTAPVQRVIIPLDEEPRKGHGLGQQYWLNSGSTSSTSKVRTQDKSKSQAIEIDDSGGEGGGRASDGRQSNTDREGRDTFVLDSLFASAPSRHSDSVVPTSTFTQTIATDSQHRSTGKRPAAQESESAAKRPRHARAPPTVAVEDDDGDELKFRRRRR